VAESLRIKKPKQECFNCLSTDHRVTDCPVKVNNDRIAMHRSEFNSQSMQSNDQANLFSTRYTSDPDAKLYKGFTPGKLSDELRRKLIVVINCLFTTVTKKKDQTKVILLKVIQAANR